MFKYVGGEKSLADDGCQEVTAELFNIAPVDIMRSGTICHVISKYNQ